MDNFEKTQKTEEGVKIIQADALLAEQVNAQTLKHARLFMDGLKAFNFEPMWENTDGKTLVHLAIDDKDRIVCLFDGDNGQLFKAFAIVDGVPADKVTEAMKLCNELNTKYMWAKFSVGPGQNDNKGIHFGIDALLADADTASQAIALLLKFIDVCEAEISNIRSFRDKLNVASQTERNIKIFNDALRAKAEKEKAKQQKMTNEASQNKSDNICSEKNFCYATPEDDPGYADARNYDINKHPAEYRVAQNGKTYIAIK